MGEEFQLITNHKKMLTVKKKQKNKKQKRSSRYFNETKIQSWK